MNFFVSGGSRGIGKAIVEAFLKAGHDVAFSYNRGEEEALKIVEQVRSQFPERKVRAYKMNVTSSQEVDAVGEKVLDDFQDLHGLVCNAAVSINGLVVNQSDEDWNQVLQTNLTGSFYLTRFYLQHFLQNRFGRIVLLSSVSRNGASGQGAYAASKAGLLGLGLTIAKEYGAKGITCNIVTPGYIDTEMTQTTGSSKLLDFWMQACPSHRSGTCEEVAGSVLHLCSKDSAFVNGTEIWVSGGLNYLP